MCFIVIVRLITNTYLYMNEHTFSPATLVACQAAALNKFLGAWLAGNFVAKA